MRTAVVSNADNRGPNALLYRCNGIHSDLAIEQYTFSHPTWGAVAQPVGHSTPSVKSAQVVAANMLTIAARYIHSNNECSNFF